MQQERESRKAANRPALSAPMTSELGNVTPVVFCPGAWTDKQIREKAQIVVGNLASNAGCDCLAPRLIVMPKEWHLVRPLSHPRHTRLDASSQCSHCPPTRPCKHTYMPGPAARLALSAHHRRTAVLQADKMEAVLKKSIEDLPDPTPAWYPNTEQVYERFCDDTEDYDTVEPKCKRQHSNGAGCLGLLCMQCTAVLVSNCIMNCILLR
jgi:hypothetical protein